MKFLLILFSIIFSLETVAQQNDSLYMILSESYEHNDTVLLKKFLLFWKDMEVTNYELDDTLKNVYQVYNVVFNDSFFVWTPTNQALNQNKEFNIIYPPFLYSIGELKVKDDNSKIKLNKLTIYGNYTKKSIFSYKKTIKLKKVKRKSQYMYISNKYQFDSFIYHRRVNNFHPKIENTILNPLYINDSIENILKRFMGYDYLPFNYDSPFISSKEAFLFQNVGLVNCPLITGIELNSELNFAIVHIYPCMPKGYKKVDIYLRKQNNLWKIIYPTIKEPHIYYSLD